MAEATEKVTVTMQDGKVIEFSEKKRMVKESLIEGGQVILRFDFANGKTIHYTLPEGMILQFAAHGGLQKFGDEIAGVKDVDDCVLSIEDMVTRINSGDWNAVRKGDSMAGTSILARAMVEWSGKPIEKIREFLKGKSHGDKQALRNHAQIKPIIERLEAEKAEKAGGAKVDTQAMLDELSGIA